MPSYRWNIEQARAELEKRRDRPIPEDHWQFLVTHAYVEELQDWDPPSERVEKLDLSYRGLLQSGELTLGRASGDRRAEYPIRAPWLGADEMTLAAAIGEAMAQRAQSIPSIKNQHERLKNGTSNLTAEDAREIWAENLDAHDLETRRFVGQVARVFGWQLEDAAVYALAGWVAPVDPIVGSILVTEFPDEHGSDSPRSRARIVLEFDPWVSLDTVSNAYWSLRHRLIGAERKPPQSREIEAFRFVIWRLNEDGRPIKSWNAIGREWNDQHQEDGWAYAKPGDIKRAYDRVRERCINFQFPYFMGERGEEPLPVHGRERGYRQRVAIDPKKREPNDLVPPGGGPPRTIARHPEQARAPVEVEEPLV